MAELRITDTDLMAGIDVPVNEETTVVVELTGALEVVTDLPPDAPEDVQKRYEYVVAYQGREVVQTLADDRIEGNDTLELRFEGLPRWYPLRFIVRERDGDEVEVLSETEFEPLGFVD